MGPNLTSVLIKREAIWILKCHPGRRLCEGQGQDWVMDLQIKDAPNCQQITRSWKGAWHGFSLTAPAGTNPTGNLISDFRPPELEEGTFLLFKPLS